MAAVGGAGGGLLPLRLRSSVAALRRAPKLRFSSSSLSPPPPLLVQHLRTSSSSSSLICCCCSSPHKYNYNYNHRRPILSLSLIHHHNVNAAFSSPSSSLADLQQNSFQCDQHQQNYNDDNNMLSKGGAIWRVVLLGWLGAEQKQLKRYAQLYQSKGINPLPFVVPVKDALSFDLGRSVQQRINLLVQDLVSWCSQDHADGRQRYLIFHTFSNTGWLAYGHILDILQTRPDILNKIRGCVVDSGAAAEINPKVWAAGFTAALLKKGSSLTYSSMESIEASKLNGRMGGLGLKDKRPNFLEIIVFYLLEIFFSIVLMLPDVNWRLTKIISILSDKQPHCPQLYLYSSADKVIPADSVVNFIKKQKAMGRNVNSYDFVTSPHVDHLRRCPEIYSAKVDEFLKECCKAIT